MGKRHRPLADDRLQQQNLGPMLNLPYARTQLGIVTFVMPLLCGSTSDETGVMVDHVESALHENPVGNRDPCDVASLRFYERRDGGHGGWRNVGDIQQGASSDSDVKLIGRDVWSRAAVRNLERQIGGCQVGRIGREL